MKDFIDKGLKASLRLLFSIPDFQEFYYDFSIKHKIECKDEFLNLTEEFRKHLSSKRKISESENLILKHVSECIENESYAKSNHKIFMINKKKILNEKFLHRFNFDFSKIVTDEQYFEETNKGKYRTKSENIALFGVDGKKLRKLYDKYKEYNHPYIYNKISEPILKAKNFSSGIPILKKALKYAFRYPNYYWNSIEGTYACATSLYQIQYLLGHEGLNEINKRISNFEVKILKLIYLYLSRLIYMSDENILSLDAYSNRARIVRDYNNQFTGIFGFGVNPDIQYISDKYLAYNAGIKHNLNNEPIIQFFWDSLKMYRHGSHIPNNTGGYQEKEDANWMQLVQRGKLRSIKLSESILSEFENYDLNLNNTEVDFICDYAMKRNKDDFENYIKEIKGKD